MDALTIKRRSLESQQQTSEAPLKGPSVQCVRSESLFGRTREILIEHGGSYYRLRVTHSNKLILTK
ncbi:MAG TPA: hemin uptake protein HemP [Povalibacter sp.]